MTHPDFSTAAAHITAERIRDTLVEMVDISSPTGREAQMAQYLVQRMRAVGMDTDLQLVDEGRPNAVGHLRGCGTGTNLLFTGHMDTSYSGEEDYLSGEGFQPKAVVRDGWIWGLGANNMKSGLAAALVAIEAIIKSDIRLDGDISLGGVVGEIEKAPMEEFQGVEYSGYGAGSKHMVTHGVTADYAVLAEPTGLRIATANMGCIWLRITVGGTVSHSALSNRPNVVNAIALMHELQNDIAAWAREYEQRHEFRNEHPNVTVAAIRGGAAWRLSRNPHSCSLYLDIRTVPGQTTDMVKRELRTLLAGFAQRTGSEEPELYVYVTDPPMLIDEELPVVDALGEAQRAVMGERHPSILRRPGADAVHFTRYDVPCVLFGPGGRVHPDTRGKSMHAFGEHVLIDDVMTAARIYLATALDLCSRNPAVPKEQ
jgi:acetylornithine deacetylase